MISHCGEFDMISVDLHYPSFRKDTTPSILECPIDSNTPETNPSKRTKLSEEAETTTIASQIKNGAYENIEGFLADIEIALSKSTTEAKGDSLVAVGNSALSKFRTEQASKASAFKMELRNLVIRETLQRPQNMGISLANNLKITNKTHENLSEDRKSGTVLSHDSSSRTVLTLYGSAPQPKQLFSSLQEPTVIRIENDSSLDDIPRNQSSALLPDLRESALPNGISTTKVIPIHNAETTNEKQRTPTLGDLFAPPANVPSLNPPRQSRHTATRSSSVNWYNPAEAAPPGRSHRRETYTTQPLSTGQWLVYNVAPSPTLLSSPEAKRKQRDRALSIGEPKPSLPQEVVVAHQQAKEDALFKSVYSSFAPIRDDAAALVPEKIKNQLWWNRIGGRKFQDILHSVATPDQDFNLEEPQPAKVVQMSEEQEFKEVVDSWLPDEVPPEFKVIDSGMERKDDDKDVAEVLTEISDLLETLNSYQRVRNLSLATNSRTTAGQNPQLAAMSGSPTSPSSAEFDVYSMLKSQLSLMIAMLPPYAVAKLNGDQLEALSISTRIPIDGKNFRGTMEEDDFTLKAKQTTMNAAAGTTARTANPATSLSTRTQHYQASTTTPAQRLTHGSNSTVPRPTAPSATYPSQQFSSRASSISNNYATTASHANYPSQRPPSSSSHRNSLPTQPYGQQTPQPGQYTNGSRQYSGQNGHSYSQQYVAPQQATSPAPVLASQFQRPSQPGYQQRAQNTSSYGYGPPTPGRSASPQTPAIAYTPQQRATYAAPVSNTPSSQRPQYYPQTATPASANLNALQLNGATGTVGQHLGLTADEQAMLMNRQKAQLAQHMQMNNIRQGSGTPQPSTGPLGGQTNGTAVAQSNGVMVGPGE